MAFHCFPVHSSKDKHWIMEQTTVTFLAQEEIQPIHKGIS